MEKREMTKPERVSGMVIYVRGERGFGFLRTEDDREIFFHEKALLNCAFNDLREGNMVEFSVIMGHGREKAVGIEVVA